jgi:flavodoxin
MHIHIIFSSWWGNTTFVVNAISEFLQQKSYIVTKEWAWTATEASLDKGEVIIFAAPTYDHGVLHAPFQAFIDRIYGKDLTGKQCAVVWLGDDKYDQEYTIESAHILNEFIKTHHGKCIIPPLRIHKTPITQTNTSIAERTELLHQYLLKHTSAT